MVISRLPLAALCASAVTTAYISLAGRPAAILFAANFSLLQRRSGRAATNNATISMGACTTGSTKNVSPVASSSAGCQEFIDAIVEPAHSAAEGLELTVFCSSATY